MTFASKKEALDALAVLGIKKAVLIFENGEHITIGHNCASFQEAVGVVESARAVMRGIVLRAAFPDKAKRKKKCKT